MLCLDAFTLRNDIKKTLLVAPISINQTGEISKWNFSASTSRGLGGVKDGAGCRHRTRDRRFTKPLLCHLS